MINFYCYDHLNDAVDPDSAMMTILSRRVCCSRTYYYVDEVFMGTTLYSFLLPASSLDVTLFSQSSHTVAIRLSLFIVLSAISSQISAPFVGCYKDN